MIPKAADCVRTMFNEVGYYCTGKKDKYALFFDKKMPNFYNGDKYGVADFCDIFFDYCIAVNCGGSEKDAEKVLCQPAKSCGAGVEWSYKYYKAKKRNTSIGHYGDQIFLSKNGTIDGLYHTGGVYKVTAKCYYYVAANEGATVKGKKVRMTKKHRINKNDKRIFAFGRPLYSDWKTIP